MKFEWDERKNEVNIRNHGFDFADAHQIFDLPILAAVDTREPYGETRYIGVGFLKQRVVVVVFVEEDNDTIRIISLRKALKHERERFGKFLQDELGARRPDEG